MALQINSAVERREEALKIVFLNAQLGHEALYEVNSDGKIQRYYGVLFATSFPQMASTRQSSKKIKKKKFIANTEVADTGYILKRFICLSVQTSGEIL